MQFDRFSKAAIAVIAAALTIIAIGQLQPGPVVAQQPPAGSTATGDYEVTSPERDYAWIVTPDGEVWFCQSSFRGNAAGCVTISPPQP